MEVKYLDVKEKCDEHKVSTEYINTVLMVADPFPKALSLRLYKDHVGYMDLLRYTTN
jgi:hypothetical protein